MDTQVSSHDPLVVGLALPAIASHELWADLRYGTFSAPAMQRLCHELGALVTVQPTAWERANDPAGEEAAHEQARLWYTFSEAYRGNDDLGRLPATQALVTLVSHELVRDQTATGALYCVHMLLHTIVDALQQSIDEVAPGNASLLRPLTRHLKARPELTQRAWAYCGGPDPSEAVLKCAAAISAALVAMLDAIRAAAKA